MDKTFNIAIYIERVANSIDGFLAHPWLWVLLFLLSLILLHRHSVIAFGSRRVGLVSMGTLAVLLLLPVSSGYPTANKGLLSLIILEYIGELQLTSLYKRRHPIFTYNIGLLLSLLTFIHRGFLLVLPLLVLQINYLEQKSWRHYSSLLFGLLTPWWIYLLFMAPAPEEIGTFLQETWHPLWSWQLPQGSGWLSTATLFTALIVSLSLPYTAHERAIQRHRIIIRGQLTWALALSLLHLLYGGSGEAMLFYSGAIFFLVAHLYYYPTNRRSLLLPQLSILLIALIALALQYVGLFN